MECGSAASNRYLQDWVAVDDRTLRSKLNQLVKLSNELDAEAKLRWGKQAMLFFEAEGGFYLMDGDSDGGCTERQQHVRFSVFGSRMGAGAW